MKDIFTVLLSIGLSSVVSWMISRSNMKLTARLQLYERRRKIFDTCFLAIRETMHSFVAVPVVPLEYYEGNENLLKELVFAERESARILSDVHPDILELEKIVHRISHLQHLVSAVFGYRPTQEEVKKHQEDLAKYTEELKVLKKRFFEDYKLEGAFMKKFNDAINIKE